MDIDRSLLERGIKNEYPLFYFEKGRWVPFPGLISNRIATEEQWITELTICPVGIMELDIPKLGQVHFTTRFNHMIGSHDDEWEYFIDLDVTAMEMGFKAILILANNFPRAECPVLQVACPDETLAVAYSMAMEQMDPP